MALLYATFQILSFTSTSAKWNLGYAISNYYHLPLPTIWPWPTSYLPPLPPPSSPPSLQLGSWNYVGKTFHRGGSFSVEKVSQQEKSFSVREYDCYVSQGKSLVYLFKIVVITSQACHLWNKSAQVDTPLFLLHLFLLASMFCGPSGSHHWHYHVNRNKIKQNWAGAENLDISFCVIFDRYYKNCISGKKDWVLDSIATQSWHFRIF